MPKERSSPPVSAVSMRRLVDKTGEPKSAQRRAARGQRRVIRRRRQRMNKVRKLLHANGLLPESTSEALHKRCDAFRRKEHIRPSRHGRCAPSRMIAC